MVRGISDYSVAEAQQAIQRHGYDLSKEMSEMPRPAVNIVRRAEAICKKILWASIYFYRVHVFFADAHGSVDKVMLHSVQIQHRISWLQKSEIYFLAPAVCIKGDPDKVSGLVLNIEYEAGDLLDFDNLR